MAEIVSCPACQRKLQVPEDYFGKTVQCPECKRTFTAGPSVNVPPSAPIPPRAPEWEKSPKKPFEPDDETADERPRRRPREDEDGDDDDFGVRRPRRPFAPHRGGMILTFGILGITVCAFFAIAAWIMGHLDLKEIRAGRMDPEGEGMTQAGRILGMISTILLMVVFVFYCGFIMLVLALEGGGRRF